MRIAPHDPFGQPVDFDAVLDGGQTFAWWRLPGPTPAYVGRAGPWWVHLTVDPTLGPGVLVPGPGEPAEVMAAVTRLLDWGHDYRGSAQALAAHEPALAPLVEAGRGVRLVRLDPWEALLSFLLSTHTHIPRIKGMLGRLCSRAGVPAAGCISPEPGAPWGTDAPPAASIGLGYQIPSPTVVAQLGETELRRLGLGYRARFVGKVAGQEVVTLLLGPEAAGWRTEVLRERLMQLPGVGRKVAECVLLFGYSRWDAFPIDRWVRRALEALYFRGATQPLRRLQDLAQDRFGPYQGLAQAYLFHGARRGLLGRTTDGNGRAPGPDMPSGPGRPASFWM